MNKRNSQKKLNGEILLMQNELMSKLANLAEPKKATDELGFNLQEPREESDALLTLISKSKNIVITTPQRPRTMHEKSKSPKSPFSRSPPNAKYKPKAHS